MKEITDLFLRFGSQIGAFQFFWESYHVTDLEYILHHMGIIKASIKLVICHSLAGTTIKSSVVQFRNSISAAAPSDGVHGKTSESHGY